MVGGVSIGSLVGGLWCLEKNITTMTQKARDWSRKMTQWFVLIFVWVVFSLLCCRWRQLLDLTYPVTSIFTGKDFNHTLQSTFGDVCIEDLWLPYFNVTTDISSSSMRIHRHGMFSFCVLVEDPGKLVQIHFHIAWKQGRLRRTKENCETQKIFNWRNFRKKLIILGKVFFAIYHYDRKKT